MDFTLKLTAVCTNDAHETNAIVCEKVGYVETPALVVES